ncbi:hypothetical protein C4580_04580 [Candidatus Woesearchaeota archaeon]|nr:MAG: hypothetical protein C4580_04580 [Candidatus Woesearchaeota archaeon]
MEEPTTTPSLGWLDEADETPVIPEKDRPAEKKTIFTHVLQVRPEKDGDRLFFGTFNPGTIPMAVFTYDPHSKTEHYDWEPHGLNEKTTRFHHAGPFFTGDQTREENARKATQVKRLPNGVVFFGDEHADAEFKEGHTEPVFQSYPDALGYFRQEAHVGIKKAYRPWFDVLDRQAINLLSLLCSGIRFGHHDDPVTLEDRLTAITTAHNIQQLLGFDVAAYWQQSNSESLRIKSNDYKTDAQTTRPVTERLSRARIQIAEQLGKIIRHQTHYASESTTPNLEDHIAKTVRSLPVLYGITHPASSILLPLTHTDAESSNQTAKNLTMFHQTVRSLIGYFGHEKIADGTTLLEHLKEGWGNFEGLAREAKDPVKLFAASPWKKLYAEGHALTIPVPDIRSAIETSQQFGYTYVLAPSPLGPGLYAEISFADNEGKKHRLGLYQPNV